MGETWKSLAFLVRQQNCIFRVLILAKRGSCIFSGKLFDCTAPSREWTECQQHKESPFPRASFWWRLQYPGVFRHTHTHTKWSPGHQRGQWPGQKRKCRQPVWGWDHLKKCSEAKPVSEEGFWLVKSRINDKETAISMILNIPLKYAINRLALGRARTKDEHKTAGKMQKSSSRCAGRWRHLVNPLQSSLSYKEKKGKKLPKVSVNIYLLG